MLKMSQVNYIRDLSNSGYRIAEISKKLKLDRKMVRKYLNQEDFSPTPPVKYPVPSKLDPYKPKILEWLAEDQHVCQGLRNIFEYIGVKACQMGLKTKFFSVIELVLKLSEARKQGTLEKLLKDLKKQGVWVFGTAADGNTTLYNADLKGPAAIVIGSEGTGMTRLAAENCDFLVSIPMKGKISSLNASAAAAILLYEAVRQRG